MPDTPNNTGGYQGGTVFPGGVNTGQGLSAVTDWATVFNDFRGILTRAAVGGLGISLVIVALVLFIGSDKELTDAVTGAAGAVASKTPQGAATKAVIGAIA